MSATPIQQRKEEYLKLLRLIQPSIYDEIDIEDADYSATEEIANVYSTTVPAHNEAKLSGDETEGQDVVTVDYEFSFNEDDKTATVTGYIGEGGQLVIPDTVVVQAGTTEIVALDSDAKEGEECFQDLCSQQQKRQRRPVLCTVWRRRSRRSRRLSALRNA